MVVAMEKLLIYLVHMIRPMGSEVLNRTRVVHIQADGK